MANDVMNWDDLLKEVGSGGGGNIYYVKEKKTTLKLVSRSGQTGPHKFFVRSEKNYQGKISAAYIAEAIVIKTTKEGDQNVDPNRVRFVRFTTTQLQGIISLLTEDNELFDLAEGKGIIITKITSGDRTTYSVQATAKVIAVDPDKLEWPEMTLEEAGEAEATAQRARGEGKDDAKSGKSTRAAAASDDDDDIPF